MDSYNSHFEVRIQSSLPRCPTPLRLSLDLEGCKFVERDSDLKIIRHKLIVKTLGSTKRLYKRGSGVFERLIASKTISSIIRRVSIKCKLRLEHMIV